jgi:hypothetical protein
MFRNNIESLILINQSLEELLSNKENISKNANLFFYESLSKNLINLEFSEDLINKIIVNLKVDLNFILSSKAEEDILEKISNNFAIAIELFYNEIFENRDIPNKENFFIQRISDMFSFKVN